MKIKLILISIFLIIYSLFFFINTSTANERINLELNKQIKDLKIHYALTKDYFLTDAKSIRDNLQSNQKIIDIFVKAQNANEKERKVLRQELYELLLPMYKRIQTRGILQFQFVFTNNISFLRMHKPSKYGDDLSDVRYSFKHTNLTLDNTEGFEQGRTTHGFRYVFPFFDKDGKHIGAVDIALSSYAIQEKLLNINKIYSHFLVKKDVFNVKEWDVDKLSKQYLPSIEHADYLFSTTIKLKKEKLQEIKKYVIKPLRHEIDSLISKDKPFALYTPFRDTIKVMTCLPVKNIKDKKTVAYIVSYTDNNHIYHTLKNLNISNIIVFIGLIILFYFFYKNLNHEKELKNKNTEMSSLLASYDKNVMYSSTDLEGYITDVSDAFCKVSGYTRKELIGENHNIVRHPDTPSSTFENLWELLPTQVSFESEVKNLKKDGGFYWVKSFFAPEYDKYGKHIGYTAVRDNITDRKEVEALQSEIEETQKEIIFKMGSIAESRSRETGLHVRRVAEYSRLFALKYGLPKEEVELLKRASPMHDIGKVAIADDILNKPAKLTDEEMITMKTHSKLGFNMLHGSKRPLLNTAAIVAYQHHEKWDGSGYPQGLTALEIHVYGRITAIADVFDALGSSRVYKEAWDDERIFEFFKKEKGKHFEPKLVDIFFDNLDEFLAIRNKLSDV